MVADACGDACRHNMARCVGLLQNDGMCLSPQGLLSARPDFNCASELLQAVVPAMVHRCDAWVSQEAQHPIACQCTAPAQAGIQNGALQQVLLRHAGTAQ